MKVHLYGQNICNYCTPSKICKTMDKLYYHQRLNHKPNTIIECYICQQTFSRFSKLAYHLVWRHEKGGGSLCHICGVAIKYGNLKRHLRTTHAPDGKGIMNRLPNSIRESLKCSYCSFTTLYKNRLTKHIKAKHPKKYALVETQELTHCVGLSTQTRCKICGQKFAFNYQLLMHIETHRGFECHICTRMFNGQQHFDLHLKTHSMKERPFKCSVCGATFTREPHLKNHFRRKHSDERPYTCEICDKAFAQRYEVRAHMRIVHLKLKPHRCVHCTRTFSTSGGLKYHETTHTGVHLHQCVICHKGFNTTSALGDHIGLYH